MSQNFTYTFLVEQVPNYMERRDSAFLAQIPVFIVLAENRLATDMKQTGYQSVVTGNLPLSNVMDKPAWWRETISFTYKVNNSNVNLDLRSLEYVKEYWPSSNVIGTPRYYADYDFKHFYLAATPGIAYPFELTYYARLSPLTDDNQENWNTLNAPQALLAAVMREAAIWCKNAKAAALWDNEYKTAVTGIVGENDERRADRNTVVTR